MPSHHASTLPECSKKLKWWFSLGTPAQVPLLDWWLSLDATTGSIPHSILAPPPVIYIHVRLQILVLLWVEMLKFRPTRMLQVAVMVVLWRLEKNDCDWIENQHEYEMELWRHLIGNSFIIKKYINLKTTYILE